MQSKKSHDEGCWYFSYYGVWLYCAVAITSHKSSVIIPVGVRRTLSAQVAAIWTFVRVCGHRHCTAGSTSNKEMFHFIHSPCKQRCLSYSQAHTDNSFVHLHYHLGPLLIFSNASNACCHACFLLTDSADFQFISSNLGCCCSLLEFISAILRKHFLPVSSSDLLELTVNTLVNDYPV